MESRWYIPLGKTLENTKIAERRHALHINKTEWGKITGHLDRKKLIQEAIDRDKEKIQRMKDEHQEMTKDWENSTKNLALVKDKERQAKQEASKNKSMQAYNEMRKEQEAERAKYVEKMRKSMYMKQNFPKALNSALMQSEVLYEREKQIEFNEMLHQHKLEDDAKWARIIKDKAEEELREDEEKKKELHRKQLRDRDFYLSQIIEKEEQQRQMSAVASDEALQDALAMAKEMRDLEIFQLQEKQEKNLKARQEMQAFKEMQDEEKRQAEIESQEIDEIIAIHAEAKERIECLIKLRAEQIHKEEVAKREAMAGAIAKQEQDKMDREEELLQKALEEKRLQEEEKEREKREKEEKAMRDMKEDLEHHLKRKAKEEMEEAEYKKWELLNRVKQLEAMEEYDKKHKIEEREKVLAYRKALDEQLAYKAEEERLLGSVAQETAEFLKQKLEEEDSLFFEYAKEVLEHARSRGRTTMPIERVIKQYQKENNIDNDKIPPQCQEVINQKPQPKEKLLREAPGKRAHCPCTDPTYGHCRCRKDRLYK